MKKQQYLHVKYIGSNGLYFDPDILGLKISTQSDVSEKMEQAKNYMLQNWDKAISVKDISSHVSICESRFYYFFKIFFSCSPHEYMTDLKLKKALDLKKEHNYSWTEIAEMCCYTDVSAFSHQFKKKYGVSPKDFRK
ncbi:MAG: AraC family transcriptional regulator [Bacteroidota bacterium]|nr:AraC family transcriptional regulator [Bacteroidota bacterium]